MYTVAADLGGTRIKVGVIRDGQLLATRILDAQAQTGLRARLPALEQQIRDACAEAKLDLAHCGGIGMAFPCLIDYRASRITSAIDKYPDVTEMDLPAWARQTLGLRLVLENDAHAALAGEWQFGSAKGSSSVVLMTLGTGVGTSAIIDGVPLRGQHGQAGCLGGHVTINMDGRRCVCGNIGCVETEASSWALPQVAKADPAFAQSALAQEPVIDYRAVFRLADAGDKLAARLLDRSLRGWGAAAVALIHAYDPELIVIGGGVMKTPQPILSFVQKYVDDHAWLGWGRVMVRAGTLGDSAALLGMSYFVERAVGAGA